MGLLGSEIDSIGDSSGLQRNTDVAGEYSREFLGRQGDQTGHSQRNLTLNIHGKN